VEPRATAGPTPATCGWPNGPASTASAGWRSPSSV
jgi:hypothetical protein